MRKPRSLPPQSAPLPQPKHQGQRDPRARWAGRPMGKDLALPYSGPHRLSGERAQADITLAGAGLGQRTTPAV